jgi:Fe-S-cluster containining protein
LYFRSDIRLPDQFTFSCRQCGSCCRNIGIQLSPLDVWYLARELGISTGEFLIRHTRLLLESEGAFWINVFLSGALDGPCSFLTGQLCGIYTVRPGTCRLHPIGSYMGLVEAENGPVPFWGYVQRVSPLCCGWEPGTGEPSSVREYIVKQGAEERLAVHLSYADYLNRLYWEYDVPDDRATCVDLVNRLFNLDRVSDQYMKEVSEDLQADFGIRSVPPDFLKRLRIAQATLQVRFPRKVRRQW